MIVGIAYAVISAIVQVAVIGMFDTAYDGGLQLLRRVPPTACTSSPGLLNFLMRKKSHKIDESMTAAKSVIFQSSDSVLCLNRNESIEVPNQAVTQLFGYTLEQLLGQNINCLLLIGDVYMAASGLFTPEEPEINHATQTVQFALDCLSCLEEANAQLRASLQVRIGINTGGPLIAGVLSTDKPTSHRGCRARAFLQRYRFPREHTI